VADFLPFYPAGQISGALYIEREDLRDFVLCALLLFFFFFFFVLFCFLLGFRFSFFFFFFFFFLPNSARDYPRNYPRLSKIG